MLDDLRITEVTRDVVQNQVAVPGLERVLTRPVIDSDGNDALRITLVWNPEAAEKLTGDNAVDLLVGIQERLEEEGEERFAIIEHATEEELATDDSDEDDL